MGCRSPEIPRRTANRIQASVWGGENGTNLKLAGAAVVHESKSYYKYDEEEINEPKRKLLMNQQVITMRRNAKIFGEKN
jgi:hypothetical protein